MMNKFRSCCSKVANFTQRRGFQSTKKQMGGDAHHKPAEINTHGKKFNMFEQYPEFDPMSQIPKRELLLARIAGASATFYVLYMIKNHGGHVFGWGDFHFEHPTPNGDDPSDDANWDEKYDEQEMDDLLELYLGNEKLRKHPLDRKIRA